MEIVSEQSGTDTELGEGTLSPSALRSVIGRLLESQQTEREAFLSALRAYKDLTTRLSIDVAEVRSELAAQHEANRLEREHVLREFLDRLDELSAKISTSAAKFSAQLEEKDRQIEDQERRVEAYAGQAADAQSVLADMRRSSSWRVTAPMRILSRLVARRTRPETHTDR